MAQIITKSAGEPKTGRKNVMTPSSHYAPLALQAEIRGKTDAGTLFFSGSSLSLFSLQEDWGHKMSVTERKIVLAQNW